MKDREIEEMIKKVRGIVEKNKIDLSSSEDLSIAIMNLVSIEEHFFFTAVKTKKDKYFDLLDQVRKIRKDLLKRIVKDYEGEIWCISKHLLAASMRLIEVGTKEWKKGNKKEAKVMFEKAYDLYSLFWGINLNITNIGKVKKIEDNKIDVKDEKNESLLNKLSGIVNRILDCCKE